MAFEYMIQGQGPQIDISLFGNAAAQGTQIGNASPSPWAAAAKGISQGITQVEDIRTSEANIAQKQAQTAQMPEELALKRQQLENEAKLQAQQAAALEEVTKQKQLADDWLSTKLPGYLQNPSTMGNALADPALGTILGIYPHMAPYIGSMVEQYGQTPQEKAIGTAIKGQSAFNNELARMAMERSDKFQTALGELPGNPIIASVLGNAGALAKAGYDINNVQPDILASRLSTQPERDLKTGAETGNQNIVLQDANDPSKAHVVGSYDPKIVGNETYDAYKKLQTFQGLQRLNNIYKMVPGGLPTSAYGMSSDEIKQGFIQNGTDARVNSFNNTVRNSTFQPEQTQVQEDPNSPRLNAKEQSVATQDLITAAKDGDVAVTISKDPIAKTAIRNLFNINDPVQVEKNAPLFSSILTDYSAAAASKPEKTIGIGDLKHSDTYIEDLAKTQAADELALIKDLSRGRDFYAADRMAAFNKEQRAKDLPTAKTPEEFYYLANKDNFDKDAVNNLNEAIKELNKAQSAPANAAITMNSYAKDAKKAYDNGAEPVKFNTGARTPDQVRRISIAKKSSNSLPGVKLEDNPQEAARVASVAGEQELPGFASGETTVYPEPTAEPKPAPTPSKEFVSAVDTSAPSPVDAKLGYIPQTPSPALQRRVDSYAKSPAANKYKDTIDSAASEHGVDSAVVHAVALVESNGNPRAVGPKVRSGKQAQGMFQVMDEAITDSGVPVKNPKKLTTEENIRVGVAYLAKLIKDNKGDVKAALAAYNWGPANYAKFVSGKIDSIPTETKEYVKNIMTLIKSQAV